MQDVGKFTVLLVDDDKEQRDYLAAKFKQTLECEILHAETVSRAKEHLNGTSVNVIISDFLLPDGTDTGVDLLRAASGMQIPNPILVLTTGFEDLLPDEAFKTALAGVFRKPFNATDLIATVMAHIRPELLAQIKHKAGPRAI